MSERRSYPCMVGHLASDQIVDGVRDGIHLASKPTPYYAVILASQKRGDREIRTRVLGSPGEQRRESEIPTIRRRAGGGSERGRGDAARIDWRARGLCRGSPLGSLQARADAPRASRCRLQGLPLEGRRRPWVERDGEALAGRQQAHCLLGAWALGELGARLLPGR